MTSSRSIGSTSKRVLLALLVLCALAGVAQAKKRVVVIDFTGPKADGFQAQIEGVIKRSASLVSAEKWNAAADDIGGKMNAKTIAKIAGKLNVDGVVVGSVDRRGARYFVHVKLKSGATGEQVAEVQLVARSGKLTSDDLGEVRDQIGGAIAKLEAPGDAGDDDTADADDGDDAPKSKAKAKSKSKVKGKHKLDDSDDSADTADDDDSAKSKAKDKHKGFRGHDRSDDDVASADDDDSDSGDDAPRSKAKAKGKSKAKGKHASDDDTADADDSDDAPKSKSKDRSKSKAKGKHASSDDDADSADSDDAPKSKSKSKSKDKDADDGERTASSDDDEHASSSSGDDDEEIGAEGEMERDPLHRPLDALAGLSFTSRNLSFTTTPGLTNKPQGYKSGVPVTGLYVGGDFYPLAFNAKNRSITRDFGITVLFDRVLSISSQLKYTDMAGATQTASLATTEQHLALGVVFRHALNKKPDSPTIYASIRYNQAKFDINKDQAPMGVTVDIPNTDYTYIDPGVGIRYPITPKIALDGVVRFDLITNTGEMQQPDQYGAATVYGFDVDAGGDYMIDTQWFVHAGLKLSTIGFSFKGNGALSNNRDGDPTTVDVQGARDTYYGAVVTAGYLY